MCPSQLISSGHCHLMSRIWIGNEFGELPYDYSTFWQGSLLQLKIIGWKKIGSLFNLLWHKTNMTELSIPSLTIFTVSLVVEFPYHFFLHIWTNLKMIRNLFFECKKQISYQNNDVVFNLNFYFQFVLKLKYIGKVCTKNKSGVLWQTYLFETWRSFEKFSFKLFGSSHRNFKMTPFHWLNSSTQ